MARRRWWADYACNRPRLLGSFSGEPFRQERERVARAGKEALEAAISKEAMRPDIEGVLTVFAVEPRYPGVVTGRDVSEEADRLKSGSPLSQNLLQAMSDPYISIEQAWRVARDDLSKVSNRAKRPYIETDLNTAIFLHHQPAERKRYALVIANTDYAKAKFFAHPRWPGYDAEAWATLFNQTGFQVVFLKNAKRNEIEEAFLSTLDSMRSELSTAGHGTPIFSPLFMMYYGGYSLSGDGKDYLVPVDADLSSTVDGLRALIDIVELTTKARNAGGASILILSTQSYLPTSPDRR